MKIAFFGTFFNVKQDMTGIGYRIWELANVLADYHQVTVYQADQPEKLFLNSKNQNLKFKLKDAIQKHRQKEIGQYDAVIFESIFQTPEEIELLIEAYQQQKIIIFDSLVNPLEYFFYHNVSGEKEAARLVRNMIDLYRKQLYLSDYIIVGSQSEFLIMMGALTTLGRINHKTFPNDKQLSSLIGRIPVGHSKKYNEKSLSKFSPEDNPREKNKQIKLIWNGGLWDLYQPNELLKALKDLNQGQQRFYLDLMYFYKNQETKAVLKMMDFVKKEFPHNKTINFNQKPIFFSDRAKHLLNSDFIIVNAQAKSVEDKTSLRLRFRDVLLYEKPIIVNADSLLGEYVRQNKLGILIEGYDSRSITRALKQAADFDQGEFKKQVKAVKSQHTFEHTIQPLVDRLKQGPSLDKYSKTYEQRAIFKALS
jgi:hypothetical protein